LGYVAKVIWPKTKTAKTEKGEAIRAKSVSQKLGKVIQIDEDKIQQHLGELVRATVEETLNKLLDAEADQLCNAKRYQRTEERRDNEFKGKKWTSIGQKK